MQIIPFLINSINSIKIMSESHSIAGSAILGLTILSFIACNLMYIGIYDKPSYSLFINAHPFEFRLHSFKPVVSDFKATIIFDICIVTDAKVVIYDISGNEIEVIFDRKLNPGRYSVYWVHDSAASGVYTCKLSAGSFSQIEKIFVL